MPGQCRRQVDGDVFFLTPFHGHPGVGRRELKERLVGNKRDPVFLAQRLLQLISARNPSDATAENDDMSHLFPPDCCRTFG